MTIEKDLKRLNGWNYYTMRFMGIWPDERKWNEASSYLALIPVSMMLCFVCVPQTVDLFFVWDDFNSVVENLSMGNITITISMLKTIAFWINGKPLKTLLGYMAEDWTSSTEGIERESMLKIAQTTRKIIRLSTVMCHSVVYTYTFLKFITARYSDNALLFRGYFPYDTSVASNYELTTIAQLIAALYAATSYTAVDTFISTLILHVCGQLSNLRKELKKLPKYDESQFQRKLTRIVQKHDYLNRFAETIENCFNAMLLMQMLGATVQLCFQVFQAFTPISSAAKEIFMFQILFLALYVVYVLLQLYLYCFVGEKLTIESTRLANAAYDSEWYDLTPSNAKMLIMVMCRARLPLRITAGRFCSFTIILYTQILKTSLSYVSVLYAMRFK